MSQQEQPFFEHLAELRKRLIWLLVTFVICLCISFAFVNQIYAFLVDDASRFFPNMGHLKLTVLGPGEILKVYFTVAGLAAIGLTLPFLLYHIWQFIRPGLEEKEAKMAFRFLPLVFLMFLAGISFGYFFVFPLLYKFLYQIGSQQFDINYTANNYFGFLTNIVVPFGFIFEMPVAVMFLTRIGILSPRTLIQVRKYAYLVIVIVASMISPPELTSHLSVAAPMILLYEVSIVISKWMWKKRELAQLRTEAQWAEEAEVL